MNDNETTQQCPFCGETIKKAAVKCRFCHEWLVKQDAASTNEIPPPPESENTHLGPTKKINPVATNTQFQQKTCSKKLLIVVSLVLMIAIIFRVGGCIIKQTRIQREQERKQRIEQAASIGLLLDGSATAVVGYRGVATHIKIPQYVTEIRGGAFEGYYRPTSITIPNSVTSIGDGAFAGVKKVELAPGNNNFALGEKGVLIDTKNRKLLYCPPEIYGSYIIPDSVTSIGYRAFYNCDSLTSIMITNSVIFIGKSAFSYCDNLTSITIPNSVKSIGDDAFRGCDSLTSITIPNSVIFIGNEAFYGCDSLTSITIPNSVTSIGDHAFSGCFSLTSITIPNGVTTIGKWAFHGSSLTSITIPNSVTTISDGAFFGVKKVELAPGNNNFTLGEKGVLIDTKNRKLLYCPPGIDGSYIIPDSVTSIGNYAFHGCDSLTSITIPDSVTSIGDWAFWDCSSLTSITIPNSVTSIGASAFYNCYRLTSITIPNSVTFIRSAFYNCKSLTSITIPNSVKSIGDDAFKGCYRLTSITIPRHLSNQVRNWSLPDRCQVFYH